MNARIAKTYAEVAAEFDVSTRTVGDWRSKGCPGFDDRGAYDLDAIAAWRELQPDSPAQVSNVDLREELLRQECRKREAEADLKSFERDQKVGNLISEQQVNLFASLWFREAARSIRALPKKVAAGFAPSDELERFKSELEVKIETALRGIAAKTAVLAGQAIDREELEQAFNVVIDDNADLYEIILKVDGKEVASC